MYSNIDSSVIKVYNGTNHPVFIYSQDSQNLTSNRSGTRFTLINHAINPSMVYSKMQPLSLETASYQPAKLGSVRYYLPDWVNTKPLPDDICSYDVIIVSQMFAEDAKLRYYQCTDFLDRLYTVGPKVYNTSSELIGTIGLQKVIQPQPIEFYLKYYAHGFPPIPRMPFQGHSPSLSAVLQCITYFSQISNANLDFNYQTLVSFANQDIQQRRGNYETVLVFDDI